VAQISERLSENAAGDFYVDRSCIDCDLCRQIAPTVFARSPRQQQSYVLRQPAGAQATHRALMALVACPTASIGTERKISAAAAARSFPEQIESEVYHCGYAAESSYGASSYLIRRPGGNVLVDSPRAAGPLMTRLAQLGGVRWMFLSHRDDVADHRAFAERFGCQRILHVDDVTRATSDVERIIEGSAPVQLAEDLLVIPVPGHTKGSAALLFQEEFLFSGDHLWGSEEAPALEASRSVCWYSWPEQLESLRKLIAFRFRWVLPGHGRRFHADSPNQMREAITALLRHLTASSGRDRV
jgi:glyoxylase-like metal-dependent hydrolase (beta-lactamase superfamily II)/ferredoxin